MARINFSGVENLIVRLFLLFLLIVALLKVALVELRDLFGD